MRAAAETKSGGGRLLDEETMRQVLSSPGKSPLTGKYAFLRADLSERRLTDISKISGYRHLQFVNARSNEIADVSPLRSLLQIKEIDLSENRIKSMRFFISTKKPVSEAEEAVGARALEVLRLSGNEVKEVDGPLICPYLRVIDLDRNRIANLSRAGLESLAYLRSLSVAQNRLVDTAGISGAHVRYLNLSDNAIETLGANFASLPKLEELHLDGNRISTLNNLRPCVSLRVLSVERNRIVGIRQLEYLSQLEFLERASFAENPVCASRDYTHRALYRLERLRALDKKDVTAEMKVKANNAYGHDIQARRRAQETCVPEVPFVHPFRLWIPRREVPALRAQITTDAVVEEEDDTKEDSSSSKRRTVPSQYVLQAWDEGESFVDGGTFGSSSSSPSRERFEGLVVRGYDTLTKRRPEPILVADDDVKDVSLMLKQVRVVRDATSGAIKLRFVRSAKSEFVREP